MSTQHIFTFFSASVLLAVTTFGACRAEEEDVDARTDADDVNDTHAEDGGGDTLDGSGNTLDGDGDTLDRADATECCFFDPQQDFCASEISYGGDPQGESQVCGHEVNDGGAWRYGWSVAYTGRGCPYWEHDPAFPEHCDRGGFDDDSDVMDSETGFDGVDETDSADAIDADDGADEEVDSTNGSGDSGEGSGT